jgi:transposase InsO family protein
MTMKTKQELFGIELNHYLDASKKKKGEILDNLERQTKMHRRAIGRALRGEQMRQTGDKKKRGREEYYGADITSALKEIWDVLGEPCGELLHPVIESTIKTLIKNGDWKHGDEITGKLQAVSLATVKRRTSAFVREQHPLKGKSATKPSKMKLKIPVFCGPWLDVDPGHGQIDTVAHCGSTLTGDFIFSCGYSDVAILWSEYVAQWNKGQVSTRESLEIIKERIPWPWLHAHPDCGTEFLNNMVVEWCEREGIKLSRSRPYHKNDNGYIEQKNGHWVRREIGYQRLDSKEVLNVMNEFYEKMCLFRNHFVPQRRCAEKTKIGSKYQKKYDQAKTPYQRALASDLISREVKDNLIKVHESLNLLELKKEIDRLRSKIFKIQKIYGSDMR